MGNENIVEIKFVFFDEEKRARFCRAKYVNNDNLYIGVETWNDEYQGWEPWCDLTVNLPGMDCEENTAFLDINGCNPEIIAELHDKGYIQDTDIRVPSGYCSYPLVTFSQEFLDGTIKCE